jgi:hypothetical protein
MRTLQALVICLVLYLPLSLPGVYDNLAGAVAGEQKTVYTLKREEISKVNAKSRIVPKIPPKDERIRLIFDTDTKNEIDDVWAIAQAILSPERFKIEGLVAANFDNNRPQTGPDSIETSYKEINSIPGKAGLAGRWPVLHGPDPMRCKCELSESEGVEFIIKKAMESTPDDPLWIVGLGAERAQILLRHT